MSTRNSIKGRRAVRYLLIAAFAGMLAACATPPTDPEAFAEFEQANDPFEPANRLIFSFNVMVDNLVVQPVAVTYRDLAPAGLKPPIHNFLRNLTLPITFLNALLQGNLERAEQAAARFVGNLPTLLLGDYKPAGDEDAFFREDGGQTLAVWGVETGPYIMLPLLGPSNARDALGIGFDWFADPVLWQTDKEAMIVLAAASVVEGRSRNVDLVRGLQQDSFDYYATVRSFYRQRLEAQVKNGDVEPSLPAPTIAFDFPMPEAPTQQSMVYEPQQPDWEPVT